VLVLMATTFTAALCFVVGGTILADSIGQPHDVATGTAVRGPVVAHVDSEIVDINTVLAGDDGAAAGTGMVLTPSGLVLTNNHVIDQAIDIQAVDIGNGRTYNARVVGYDERRDVAVLQLEGAAGLNVVTLGNSAGVRVNRRVVTIGNAGGVGGTPAARSGTVLAVNRAIEVANDYDRSAEHLTQLIQIHGDLQPGDSGGPMVTSGGTVVGMDTAASTNFEFSDQTTGQGFAIEIDAVRPIVGAIRAGHGSSSIHVGPTAFIGVDVEQATHVGGAAVFRAEPRTAAAQAGLGPGDVITALGGKSIGSTTGLTEALVPYRPGQRVALRWRDASGVTHTTTITLGVGPAA
jgi:S1-C subfamily serine protease